jgi:Glycine zipper
MSDSTNRHTILTYTQKDVANTALSVSSLAALGAITGTFVVPGLGSVVGGLVGGLGGIVVERFLDRKSSQPVNVASEQGG